MRGSSLALSCLLTAMFLMAITVPAQAGEVDGVMKCQCACDCPNGNKDCTCECDCPEPASMCGPGFSRVCPMKNGVCASPLVAKCSGEGPATTTTTTPAPPSETTEKSVKITNFKCGKSTVKCTATVKFMSDCSTVTSVKPTCTPKKTTCNKASFKLETTVGECKITGTYKNKSGTQTASGLSISGPEDSGTGGVTTAEPASTDSPGCMCVPDFMLYWQQAMASATPDYPCVCVAPGAME